VEFDWDPAKDALTRQQRGFGFDYAIRIFAGPLIEANDRRRDYGEDRIRAIGEIDGRAFVVYTDRRRDACWSAGSSAPGKQAERICGYGKIAHDAG
jgi:uncharacterized DUF497 family protein